MLVLREICRGQKRIFRTEENRLRLAKELVKDIDMVANLTGYNRNEILTKSLEFALKNMEVHPKD